MRILRLRRFTFGVLCTGLLSVPIVAPVRAQPDAVGRDAAASARSPAEGGDAPAAGGAEGATPSLADVDIDALLSDAPPGSASDDAAAAASTRDRILEALLSAKPDGGWSEFRERVETSIGNLVDAAGNRLPEDARRFVDELAAKPLPEELQESLLLALGVLFAGLVALRLLRGRGDLAVSIEYPSELRGTFSVRVAKSRAKAKAQNRKAGRITTPEGAQRAKHEAGSGSRTERTMVSRETQFHDLAVRSWFVTVDGFLQAADGEEVLATRVEEQEIRIRRRRTVRLVFDFHPKDCPIDVKVLWDRCPVTEALVALRGVPGSLRYARGGPVRIGAGRGTHTLVVGSADRVAEHTIEVDSFQPQCLTIDLTGRENMLFTGCPPAVEPYLNGDIAGAARALEREGRALEREGQSETANLLLARLHVERGQKDIAARHFEAAGWNLEAAEIHRELANYEQSASLFENAGETAQAAAMYRSAGDFVRAGAAYERASRFDSAVECYREAGDVAKWISSLERTGAAFEAAQVSLEREDWGRAIRSLQLVPHDDPDYVSAANILIDARGPPGSGDPEDRGDHPEPRRGSGPDRDLRPPGGTARTERRIRASPRHARGRPPSRRHLPQPGDAH
jgi:hypothetical protein